MKCELEKDINTCPYYNKKTNECLNKEKCSFQHIIQGNKEYVRPEKWFKKYYKR